MTSGFEERLAAVRQRRLLDPFDAEVLEDELAAERALAEARSEQWADPIDFGVQWSGGAPLPHVMSNGSTAILVCHEELRDSGWDGTFTTVVSPQDEQPSALLEFTFTSCEAVRLGGPNDEALHGHPLHGRGLGGYRPFLVRNSSWIAEAERINSVHAYHRAEVYRRLNHFFFVFHDEMFEVLAERVQVERVDATLRDCLRAAADRLTG